MSTRTSKVPQICEDPLFAVARDIPGVAVAAIVMEEAAHVTDGPTKMHGTNNLRIDAEDSFHPVVVSLDIVQGERPFVAPKGIGDIGMVNIKLIVGVGITQTTIEAVDVMLVLHHVEVDTNLAIRCGGLVMGKRRDVILISTAIA